MPCGGIFPVEPLVEYIDRNWHCWQCNEWLDGSSRTPDHMCEEWDCVLHGSCVEDFLKTEEGKLTIAHDHLIQIYDEVLQEEGGAPGQQPWEEF